MNKAGLPAVFAVARDGVAWSPDDGETWNELPVFLDFWAVSFANQNAGWMVGVGGQDREDQLLRVLGRMFWLWWKMLSGSYVVFTSTKRS